MFVHTVYVRNTALLHLWAESWSIREILPRRTTRTDVLGSAPYHEMLQALGRGQLSLLLGRGGVTTPAGAEIANIGRTIHLVLRAECSVIRSPDGQ